MVQVHIPTLRSRQRRRLHSLNWPVFEHVFIAHAVVGGMHLYDDYSSCSARFVLNKSEGSLAALIAARKRCACCRKDVCTCGYE